MRKKLSDYWIIQGAISALCICLGAYITYLMLCDYVEEGSKYSGFIMPGCVVGAIGGLAILIYFWQDRVHKHIYHEETGRVLSIDRRKYQRKYEDLLEYFKGADPFKLDIEAYDTIPWYRSHDVILGKVGNHLITRAAGDKGSILVAGLPGDGKTTGIVIPTAARFGGSVLCVDIKGDILTAVKQIAPKRKIAVFNPSDPTGYHFNPFEGVGEMDQTRVEVLITNMAQILIPDEESKDAKFFIDGARAFFIGIFFFFYEKSAKDIPFMGFVNAILQNSFEVWLKTVQEKGGETSKKYLISFIGANAQNTGGQYSKLCESLRTLTLGALPELLNGNGKAISPSMLQKGTDVYIHLEQDLIKEYSAITTLICSSFMRYWMRLTDNTLKKPRPTIMILDEFAQMHFQSDMITGALATLRSKGVTLMIIVQSLAQLQKNYGEKDARTIAENCAYKCILSAGDPQSMKYFSDLFGTRRVLKVSTSKGDKNSDSKSSSEDKEEIFKPAEFAALNAMGEGGKVVIQANGSYVLADKCFWFKDIEKLKARKRSGKK